MLKAYLDTSIADIKCNLLKYSSSQLLAVDVCNPSPCLNGGTCVIIANNTYNCTCPPGIGGQNCTQGRRILNLIFFLESRLLFGPDDILLSVYAPFSVNFILKLISEQNKKYKALGPISLSERIALRKG